METALKKAAFSVWNNLEKYVVAISLSVMLIVTFVNVLSRFFLNMSISFMETLTINLFVWVALFGSGIAARSGAHLGLSILTDMSPLLRRVSIIITAVSSTVLYTTIAWFGLRFMRTQMVRGQMSATLNIPEWILMISVPVGCLILVIRFIELAGHEWRKEATR